MFQHANGSRDLLMEMLKAMDGNEIEVILAQRDHTIYFTKTHRQDLLTVINAINSSSTTTIADSITMPDS